MDFQIGQEINLNNKRYTIAGIVKRSWLLERNGKQYKATSNMMKKIQEQNERGVGMGKRQKRSATFHMEKRLAWNKLFNPDAKIPETEEELMKSLDVLCCELSPENLHCDGEISRSAAMKKASALRAEWKEIERKLGRKVSEEEVYQSVWTNN